MFTCFNIFRDLFGSSENVSFKSNLPSTSAWYFSDRRLAAFVNLLYVSVLKRASCPCHRRALEERISFWICFFPLWSSIAWTPGRELFVFGECKLILVVSSSQQSQDLLVCAFDILSTHVNTIDLHQTFLSFFFNTFIVVLARENREKSSHFNLSQ